MYYYIAFEMNHIIIDAEQVRINDDINYLTDELVLCIIISKYFQVFTELFKCIAMTLSRLQDYVNKFPYGGIKLVRAYLEEDKETENYLLINKKLMTIIIMLLGI